MAAGAARPELGVLPTLGAKRPNASVIAGTLIQVIPLAVVWMGMPMGRGRTGVSGERDQRVALRGRGAIRRKLVAYRDFVASGEVQRDFPDQELHLLIVGIRWSQMKRWQETAGEVLGTAGGRLGVRFTTVAQLERSGATAPAWQDMGGAWTYPFPGLAEQSGATRRQRYLDLGELRRRSLRSEGYVVTG